MASSQQWLSWTQTQLTDYPFLHLPLCETPPEVTPQERWRWRDFFARGGTLFMDYCETLSSERERAWEAWALQIYRDAEWIPLRRSDVLSFSFYLLEKRMLLGSEGVPIRLLEQNDRYIMIFNRSPRLAWSNLAQSAVRVNNNRPDTELALRFYVNLGMYLLTGDYKSDQLHLPTILLRRK